jgi:hypothetical protein
MAKIRQLTYFAGRALQLLALLVLPSAIWAGSIDHSEFKSIAIFVSCLAAFYSGYFLTRRGTRI